MTLVEFAHNKSYHASIQMAPYEALYGRNVDRRPIGMKQERERFWIRPLYPGLRKHMRK